MDGLVMSLTTREQQALDSIKDDLASCDPVLAARLTIFTRLASGEEMPARRTCSRSWATFCTGATSAPNSVLGIR